MSADSKTIKQDSLPFPPTPTASIAGRTMQESVYKRRVEPRRGPLAMQRSSPSSTETTATSVLRLDSRRI